MNLSLDQVQGKVPVTIINLQGDMDGSNYQTLITTGHEVYQTGATNLIRD